MYSGHPWRSTERLVVRRRRSVCDAVVQAPAAPVGARHAVPAPCRPPRWTSTVRCSPKPQPPAHAKLQRRRTSPAPARTAARIPPNKNSSSRRRSRREPPLVPAQRSSRKLDLAPQRSSFRYFFTSLLRYFVTSSFLVISNARKSSPAIRRTSLRSLLSCRSAAPLRRSDASGCASGCAPRRARLPARWPPG
jgi:hypothetical protein